MIEELSARIWQHPEFQKDYTNLIHDNLSHSIGVKGRPVTPLQRIEIRRLLQTATHFSASKNITYREAAYRIATAIWNLFGNEYDNIQEIAHLVLGRLGNFPAIDFLYSQVGIWKDEYLPKSAWFELTTKEETNSVWISPEIKVVLTDFQQRLWTSLANGKSTAVSAPTSAGKSFALQRYLVSFLTHHESWVLYLVPTRALINQVSMSLSHFLKDLHKFEVEVFTIPVKPTKVGSLSGIYVLTQERLQILLESDINISFGLTIIDEAQMVADGARGVILQSVVEKLQTRFPGIQFLFGSPQTGNLSIYQQIFDLETVNEVYELESPVAQNLIFLDTDSIRTNEIDISALIQGQKEILGRIVLEQSIYDPDQTLTYLSWVFGQDEKSLVYAGGQARCEKLSDLLVQLIEGSTKTDEKHVPDPELTDFSKFIKEHVHPQYLLATSIIHGVGFHYGNMPTIVRKTIEEFFDQGRLSFLVCTSTLLHGVNLPAKNLFMLDPTKGRDWDTGEDIPISVLEFWNLAGRAGRLGRDFEGNVFLIDQARWKSQPLEGERQQQVKPAISTTLTDNIDEFLNFINTRDHPSGRDQWVENTFTKVFNDYRRGDLQRTLDKALGTSTVSVRAQIEEAIRAAEDLINVPKAITERNLSISVLRQQEMLDYLIKKICKEGPGRFIPVHPLRPWEEAKESLLRMFKRIHSHFEKLPGRNHSEYYFAPLALRWMRGEPLARLIDDAYNFKKKNQKRASISTVIRNVMADIEQDLRFRYVKYTSAYNDLLIEALCRTNYSEFVERIPPISLFLELGASSMTMISLIGLGLSRTTAGILTTMAVNKDMTRTEAERWLRQRNLEAMDLPSIIFREIKRIFP